MGKIIAGETVSPYGDIGAPRDALGYRFQVIENAMSNIKTLGEGYNITVFSRPPPIVHNVPLVLIQQLGYPGILAAMAWLWVSIWCLVKTKWKYVWILILALSLFDHYIFTQLGHLWPIIVGVSTAPTLSNIKSDLLFRK